MVVKRNRIIQERSRFPGQRTVVRSSGTGTTATNPEVPGRFRSLWPRYACGHAQDRNQWKRKSLSEPHYLKSTSTGCYHRWLNFDPKKVTAAVGFFSGWTWKCHTFHCLWVARATTSLMLNLRGVPTKVQGAVATTTSISTRSSQLLSSRLPKPLSKTNCPLIMQWTWETTDSSSRPSSFAEFATTKTQCKTTMPANY